MACPTVLAAQHVWTDKHQYVDAERKFVSKLQDQLEEKSADNKKNTSGENNSNPSQKKNAKKSKKSVSESSSGGAEPTNNQKGQKNDKSKNAQSNKQQQQTEVIESDGGSQIELLKQKEASTEDTKASAKSKKQKNKKEKKNAAKKQQSEEAKSTSVSLSEDAPVTKIKHDTKQPTNVAATGKSAKDKINAKGKNEMTRAKSAEENNSNNTVDNANAKVHGSGASEECTLVSEIAKARQHLKNSLERMDDIAAIAGIDVLDRITALEQENSTLHKLVDDLKSLSLRSEERIKALEARLGAGNTSAATPASAPAPTAAKPDDDDDDVDLFGSESEEEDESANKLREQRLAEYAAKKSKKPALIAKSNVILDVKPWDDETDMKKMEQEVRKITCDGLLWGAAKLVPLAFGIHKLQIASVVEDEKVSIDWLTEEIEKIEDFVQSVDVAAFNKI